MSDAQRRKREHDLAYYGFLVPGILALIGSLGGAMTADTTIAAAVGFFILIPLAIVALAAVPAGVVYSIKVRTDAALWLLSILTIVMVIEVFAEAGSAGFYNAMGLVYGLLVLALEASWFLLRRERAYPANEKDVAA